MLKTYTGPYYEGVEVILAGQSFGIVKPGESIVIPDDLAQTVEFSDSIWQDGPAVDEKQDAPAPARVEKGSK